MGQHQDIMFEKRNRCGLITLNRKGALNAITYDMFAGLEEHYIAWAQDPDIYGIVIRSTDSRAFSSGGDIRALYDWRQAGETDKVLGLYGSEYQHNWSLEQFTKPNVSLIDGIVMGGGVGISLYGTHRLAGDNYRFAMPEVGIGFFPDVGATYFLSRLPDEIGTYLALTGQSIGPADAFALDLVTHCVTAEHYGAITEAMSEAEPIDPLLDEVHVDPGAPDLAPLRPAIARLFAADSVEDILSALDGESGEHGDWAKETAALIRTKSPTSLKVALRQMRMGKTLGLDEALKLEFRIAHRFIMGTEFYEGVRAALIDKNRTPRWEPATLEAVTEDMVDAYFAPLKTGELDLVNPYD